MERLTQVPVVNSCGMVFNRISVRTSLSLFRKHALVGDIPPGLCLRKARDMSTSTSVSRSTIESQPAAGQRIVHSGAEYNTIKEGLAYILIPESASAVPQTTPRGNNETQSVFYNPIQQFNRDLSVLAIKAYGEEALERRKADTKKFNGRRWDVKGRKKRKREETGDETSKSEEARRFQVHDKVEDLEIKPELDTSIQLGVDSTLAPNGLWHNLGKVRQLSAAGLENTLSTKSVDDLTSSIVTPTAQPRFKILDALSATGLRALRYAHEIPFVTSVTANDIQFAATQTIKMNVEHNKLTEKVTSTMENALSHMYNLVGASEDFKRKPRECVKYDVIDLDPYGTAATFLDAAVQAVRDDGGLLCVTCTDSGVWASNGYPEKGYSLYGGIPMKGVPCHEGGLRLILHAIATSAGRYGLAIEPLLSLSIDFYIRIFVRIWKSPADVKFLASKTMMVCSCDVGCGAWTTQLLAKNKLALNKSGKGTFYKHGVAGVVSANEYCSHCGSKVHLNGPFYAGPLHSPHFIQRILYSLQFANSDIYTTKERIEGMLNLALEEDLSTESAANSSTSGADPSECLHPPPIPKGRPDPAAVDLWPFYFIPSALSKIIHCTAPSNDEFRGALKGLGYRVTRSHARAGSIKTDAPWNVIWEVMREWARLKAPINRGAIKERTPGWTILGLDKDKEKAERYFGKPKQEAEEVTNGGGVGNETENVEKGGEGEHGGLDVGEREKEQIGGDMGVDLDTVKEADGERKREKIREGRLEVVFDGKLGKEKDGKGLLRYQMNPRENWGPMNKAKGHR